MPALPPYIPPRDADFNNWIDNFSTLLTAAPATYGLLASDATAVASLNSTWAAAYALAVNPSTRTPVTVAAKDTARITAQAGIRPYAVQISLNPGVLVDDKIAIGVNPRTSTPTPITTPTTWPIVTLASGAPLQQIVRYRDYTSSPTSKGKPYGVVALQLFAKASTTPILDPTLLPLKATLTKSPGTIDWISADAGMQAYVAGRWITRKGLVGPSGPIGVLTITGS